MGMIDKTEKIIKTVSAARPAKYFPKNIFMREIGRDRRISIVPFSISLEMDDPEKEAIKKISIIGQTNPKCSVDI